MYVPWCVPIYVCTNVCTNVYLVHGTHYVYHIVCSLPFTMYRLTLYVRYNTVSVYYVQCTGSLSMYGTTQQVCTMYNLQGHSVCMVQHSKCVLCTMYRVTLYVGYDTVSVYYVQCTGSLCMYGTTQ